MTVTLEQVIVEVLVAVSMLLLLVTVGVGAAMLLWFALPLQWWLR